MLTFLLTSLVFLLIFSGLILIHEWGHFFAARRNNIKVEEFGFGLPPRIWGFKKGETLYSINAIPFGGFVKLLGEDAHDTKVLANPRSFASKPAWVRILVVLAGVLMNFLLAFVLLTIGFIAGIQPLLLSAEDIFQGIENGIIQTGQGIIVKNVEEGSPAYEAGLRAGDNILQLQKYPVFSYEQLDILDKPAANQTLLFTVQRGNEEKNFQIIPQSGEKLGLTLNDVLFLPRLQVFDVGENSVFYKTGLHQDDVIWKVNDHHIYSYEEFAKALRDAQALRLTVLRGQEFLNFTVDIRTKDAPENFSQDSQKSTVIVSNVLPLKPAAEAGFAVGDVVVSVNGKVFQKPEDLMDYTKNQKTLSYEISRKENDNWVHKKIEVKPDETGHIGVVLSPLFYPEGYNVIFFQREIPLSAVKIQNVQYPFWQAPVKAFEESGRLAFLTVQMFGNVIRSLVTTLTVPEGVAGPVGIYQMTGVFVQEGIFSVMRFMALLSLSLAIINILPFPALDGGRFFFIIIELILGRRMSAKYEALIHTVGFILLMLLIAAVTFNDILRLF